MKLSQIQVPSEKPLGSWDTVQSEKGGSSKAEVTGAQRSDTGHDVGQSDTPGGKKKKKRSICCWYWNKEAPPDINSCFV